jgi:hypothetical protein
MRILKHKNGQFIMIAVLMIAIMMVSIAAIMYSAGTYYRHEKWEEYLTIVDNLKIGSSHLFEISLANFTRTFDGDILVTNLNKWQTNLMAAYPGLGIALTYSNATIGNSSRSVTSLTSDTIYFSNASAKLNIDIASVGLEGYTFVSSAFLGVILNATYVDGDDLLLYVAVEKENSAPVTGLKKDNFFVNGTSLSDYSNSKLAHTYQTEGNVLRIIYEITIPDLTPQLSSVSVAVVDNRDIKVTANSNVT